MTTNEAVGAAELVYRIDNQQLDAVLGHANRADFYSQEHTDNKPSTIRDICMDLLECRRAYRAAIARAEAAERVVAAARSWQQARAVMYASNGSGKMAWAADRCIDRQKELDAAVTAYDATTERSDDTRPEQNQHNSSVSPMVRCDGHGCGVRVLASEAVPGAANGQPAWFCAECAVETEWDDDTRPDRA